MTRLHNVIYRFSAIPIKLPMAFFTELDQHFLKFVYKPKSNLEKQNKKQMLESGTFEFVLHYKTEAIKTLLVLAQKQKYISMRQNREHSNKHTHL